MNKHAIGHDPGRSAAALTVAEFCDTHRISRTHLYQLWKDGKGPRRMKLGKLILVTTEAAAEWRARMERETAESAA